MDTVAETTERLLHFAVVADAPLACFDAAEVQPEALARLSEEVVPEWDRQQGTLNLRQRDLGGASLRSANLSHADLTGADLSNVAGGGLKLTSAQLDGAKLERIDLVGADLSGASAGEANFVEALLEDAQLRGATLRFADFSEAIVEGADFSKADLWGAKFRRASADRALFHEARMDESSLVEAQLPGADFSDATLRRADLSGARLENANLRGAVLDGANLAGADLSGASLPNLSLSSCNLTGTSFAGAWLERTRMSARQLGGAVGEEATGNLQGAIDSYVVLERNFLSLGLSEDASWAYLRKRRVGRRLHALRAKAHLELKQWRPAVLPGALWLGDSLAEWLCDYGESLVRVARAFATIVVGFAVLYWITHSLQARAGFSGGHLWDPVNYLLFSLDSMTTVGTSEVALRPSGELGILLSSLQTVIGTILLGLFGFVLGARIRS